MAVFETELSSSNSHDREAEAVAPILIIRRDVLEPVSLNPGFDILD